MIAITSHQQASGKSVMAANLAFELARNGKACLLDLDVLRASQHSYFGIINAPASLSALTRLIQQDRLQEEDFEKLTLDLVVPTSRVTLVAGLAHNADHLQIDELSFETLLEFLKLRFDHLVIDLGTLHPDNRLQQLALVKSTNVILVELADQVSIQRLIERQEQIMAMLEPEKTKLLINRARESVLGAKANWQLAETVKNHTIFQLDQLVPEDKNFDTAMLKSLPLRQVDKKSPALKIIENLATEIASRSLDKL